jgi:signal transduction histidine kinase
MPAKPDDRVRQVTSELRNDKLLGLMLSESDVKYRPVPYSDIADKKPVWRVRLDLTFDSKRRLGLDINGEVILGRGEDGPGFVGLNVYDADELGVSRHHIMLRPTDSKLYILDLESTNGTWLNGRSIGVNTPYSLSNGDLLTLGELEFVVRIIKRPTGNTAALRVNHDIVDVLTPIARAITSQLEMDEVLKQALEITMSITAVSEASIWLVDEQTGELFLEAERGIQDEQIRRLRLSVADTLAGKVIETGKPVRANRQAGDDQIKVKTGYLVEAVVYVPLTLGGVTFGVLSAAHRAPGKLFSDNDEKLMSAIADFTAVAVQNARLFQATERALARRGKVVTALNYALAYDFKKLLNYAIGYAGLLVSDATLGEDNLDIVGQIVEAGNRMAYLVDQLIEVTTLIEDPSIHHAPCDLADAVTRAVEDLRSAADAKSIALDFQLMGEPCLIQGNAAYLYRSTLNLVDNAIKYSPPGAQVSVALVFWYNGDMIIRVQDTGPGFPEDDLPHLFDKYFRGKQSTDGQVGIGLGLELVRAAVEAHRGTIVVRNAEDHGAEFIITLPSTLRVK